MNKCTLAERFYESAEACGSELIKKSDSEKAWRLYKEAVDEIGARLETQLQGSKGIQ